MKRLASTLIASLMLTGIAHAQQAGMNVSPRGALEIKNKTPAGLLDFTTRTIGTALPGEIYLIVEKKPVPTATGWDIWVKLQSTGNGNSVCQATAANCWVYWGKQDSAQKPNLALATQ